MAVVAAGLQQLELEVDGLAIAIPGVLARGDAVVDDRVRGRVSSFWGMIAFGGTSLGSLVIGAAARVWELQPAVTATGLVCAALAIVAGRSARADR